MIRRAVHIEIAPGGDEMSAVRDATTGESLPARRVDIHAEVGKLTTATVELVEVAARLDIEAEIVGSVAVEVFGVFRADGSLFGAYDHRDSAEREAERYGHTVVTLRGSRIA